MNKVRRNCVILRHTKDALKFYLRKTKNITKFCQEIRNAEKTLYDIPFTLYSFDWNKSIYGKEYWSNLNFCFKIWKKKILNQLVIK